MTQEDKQLVLIDLCGRLPYKVKVVDDMGRVCTLTLGNVDLCSMFYGEDFDQGNDPSVCKPYLRPMSSMTEEEREDFWWNVLDMDWREDLDVDEEEETVPFPFMENYCGFYLDNFYLQNSFAVIDWLNEHHFDYRGLIEKGAALEAPDGMYKIEEQR